MSTTTSALNQAIVLVLAASSLVLASSSTDTPRKARQGLLPSGLPPIAADTSLTSVLGGNILPFAAPMILLGLGILLLPMLLLGGQFLSANSLGSGFGDAFLGGGFARALSELKRKPGFPDLTELIKTVAEAIEKAGKN